MLVILSLNYWYVDYLIIYLEILLFNYIKPLFRYLTHELEVDIDSEY